MPLVTHPIDHINTPVLVTRSPLVSEPQTLTLYSSRTSNQSEVTTLIHASVHDTANSAAVANSAQIESPQYVVPYTRQGNLIQHAGESNPDPDDMLRRYVQQLANSNKLTPQMAGMLNRAICSLVKDQTTPIPMMLSSQSAKHGFYDIIRHHACYNAPGFDLNVESVIKQLAIEYPSELVNNLPGMACVPIEDHAPVRLPALIKTSFRHPTHGPMTVIALLLHMDTPKPERIKESQRTQGYERFFFHNEDENQREEFEPSPDVIGSDVDATYRSHEDSTWNSFDADGSSVSQEADCDAPYARYDASGQRMRALCLHRVVAVYPVGTPLLHSAVGRYFSSFNASLEHLGNVQPGWQGWHLLQDSTATMSRVMSTVGFVNHPAFASTRVRQQLSYTYSDEACHANAAEIVREAHIARVIAAGRSPAEHEFDPDLEVNKERIRALAQRLRQEAENALSQDVWCLRDAIACMCVHVHSYKLIGECNSVGCLYAFSSQSTRKKHSSAGREMYKCRRGHIHSYMCDQVKLKCMQNERKKAKLNKTSPRPPRELIRSARNTLELQNLLEGEPTATDTQISFLNMPKDDLNNIVISRNWLISPAGQVILKDLERQIPLLKFFTLSGRMLASPSEVTACRKYFPTTPTLKLYRHKSAPLCDLVFHKRAILGDDSSDMVRFTLTMSASVHKHIVEQEERLWAAKGPSITGPVKPSLTAIVPSVPAAAPTSVAHPMSTTSPLDCYFR